MCLAGICGSAFNWWPVNMFDLEFEGTGFSCFFALALFNFLYLVIECRYYVEGATPQLSSLLPSLDGRRRVASLKRDIASRRYCRMIGVCCSRRHLAEE